MEEQKRYPYAFDFDGVIARYDGFRGKDDVEDPIPEVVEAMRVLKSRGHTIIVYSARGTDFLRDYFSKHNIPVDYINESPNHHGENPGKPIAHVYVDDRAVCYRGQSSEELVAEIVGFRAFWETKK